MIILSFLKREITLNNDTFQNSFAVFKLNGRQYKVFEGDIVKVEKMEQYKAGEKFGKNYNIQH